jgi:hypothetical protein
MGMEGDVIITQDVIVFEMVGEDANGKIIGHHPPPASAVRASGNAPATMARPSALPPRSTRRAGQACRTGGLTSQSTTMDNATS